MSDYYRINYRRLATLILPICMRSEVMQGFTTPMMEALVWVTARFSELREASDYRLKHTGQVFSLRNALNDKFDKLDRRITIADNAGLISDLIIYKREDERPQFLKGGGTTIYRRGFGSSAVVSFIVSIPKSLKDGENGGEPINESEVRALVDTYKLAGKRYEIAYYEQATS